MVEEGQGRYVQGLPGALVAWDQVGGYSGRWAVGVASSTSSSTQVPPTESPSDGHDDRHDDGPRRRDAQKLGKEDDRHAGSPDAESVRDRGQSGDAPE